MSISQTKTTGGRMIQTSEDTIRKYGRICQRIEHRLLAADGGEIDFSWIEEDFLQAGWTAYRWSKNIGPMILRSMGPKDAADNAALDYLMSR